MRSLGCAGGSPLALSVVTALPADQPDKPLAAMARDMTEAREERLDDHRSLADAHLRVPYAP
jgi:hypothetical protein